MQTGTERRPRSEKGGPQMYDLLIRNGMVIDGTGTPRYRADVAMNGGKIAAIGKVTDGAKKVIDAGDLIVAPGFVDPHTHYDAQICWDPLISCSSWHGVTTVIMGDCGVGLAPCQPQAREVAAWDLVNVESIPFDVLAKGVSWEWESFPQYMNAAQQRGIGINLGFLAPLTPFRHYVMGEESMERAATAEETRQIQALLREAIAAGAMGFTTTTVAQHIGYKGRPLAQQFPVKDLEAGGVTRGYRCRHARPKRGAAHGEFSANRLFVRGTAPGERRLFLPGAAVSANLPPDAHSARARSVVGAPQRGRPPRQGESQEESGPEGRSWGDAGPQSGTGGFFLQIH